MAEIAADRQGVVVGVDGSEGSRRALEWAVDKQDSFGVVKPVITFVAGPFVDGFGTFAGVEPDGQPYRDEAFSHLSAVLTKTHPELLERAEVIQHWAGPGLVEASSQADLLVVGTRGRSALTETLLGSVGSYCVKHAKVPVVVVPSDVQSTQPLSTVVVGVDGSANAEAALAWALEHVAPDGTVVALGVFKLPGRDESSSLADETEAQIQKQVEKAVRACQSVTAGNRSVEIIVRSGDPRMELRREAERADLLVVGSRGDRTVAHLLLGSVASALSHHPTVATVVVPH